MNRGYFITGTDTGVGKTRVAAGLLRAFARAGRRTVAMKPVASGCVGAPGALRNDDALMLMAQMTESAPYELVNPYAFEPPIAPHLAAAAVGVDIELGRIEDAWRALPAADVAVVEGAGGWRVPLTGRRSLAAVPQRLGLPVILVVGLRLGCLNHTLLTAEAIAADGCRLAGWVGNDIVGDPAAARAQVDTLAEWLQMLPLACLPWADGAEPDQVAERLMGCGLV
jgi:dethiobiotin synthetase